MSKYFNVPVVMQILGVVVLGLVFWKSIHGFWPSFGLIAGALLLYIGRHYNTVYNEFEKRIN